MNIEAAVVNALWIIVGGIGVLVSVLALSNVLWLRHFAGRPDTSVMARSNVRREVFRLTSQFLFFALGLFITLEYPLPTGSDGHVATRAWLVASVVAVVQILVIISAIWDWVDRITVARLATRTQP